MLETKDEEITIIDLLYPVLTPAPYEGDDEMLKHLSGQHDQATHGSWATGGEISDWNPKGVEEYVLSVVKSD